MGQPAKEVACGFTKPDAIPGALFPGMAKEVFFYAIPGKENETDPNQKNELFIVMGDALVPLVMTWSFAEKASAEPAAAPPAAP